jgi:cobalamin biosynthesis Mg chelatase CobN
MKMLWYILVSFFVSYGVKSCLEGQSELKRCGMLDINIFLCFWFFIWICLFMLFFFAAEKKGANPTVDGEKKDEAPAPSESKNSKKKKNKKDKSSKEAKETQEAADGAEDNASAEPDEDTASVDVKERLKKMASMKKKKSSKETDTGAKIAAAEAAARTARLAAAKKKEKSHYNQQPVR